MIKLKRQTIKSFAPILIRMVKKKQGEDDWYCFMRDNDTKEEMIQYRMCKKWVHV